MGQATRTTKLSLDLGKRDQGGANTGKQAALNATVEVLERARAFYLDFFLAHADKLAEKVTYYSEEQLEFRERLIPPMNCSPGPSPVRRPIPIPGPAGISASAFQACRLPTDGR